MSTQVTAYKTIDGELFLTEQEATKHEQYLNIVAKIQNFLSGPENTLRNRIKDEELITFIVAWEMYRRTH